MILKFNFKVRFLSMFFISMIFMLVNVTAHALYPDPIDDYVNDFAEVITDSDKSSLQTMLKNLESQTGIEMVVVTIKSMAEYDSNPDTDIKIFSRVLFNNWKVGQLPDNDGVMILVAVDDKKTRIQMGRGYKNRYDDDMKRIIEDKMRPAFQKQYYSQGIYDGTQAVITEITTSSWFDYYKWHILLGILGVISLFAGISLMKNGKKGWGFVFLTLGISVIVALIIELLSDDEDRYEEGFGGGDSDDDGADGSW